MLLYLFLISSFLPLYLFNSRWSATYFFGVLKRGMWFLCFIIRSLRRTLSSPRSGNWFSCPVSIFCSDCRANTFNRFHRVIHLRRLPISVSGSALSLFSEIFLFIEGILLGSDPFLPDLTSLICQGLVSNKFVAESANCYGTFDPGTIPKGIMKLSSTRTAEFR